MDKQTILSLIDNNVLDLYSQRFKNEIEYNNMISTHLDTKINHSNEINLRNADLEKILSLIEESKITVNNNIQVKNYTENSKTNKFNSFMDDVSFNKDWDKLHKQQKIIKIEEYLLNSFNKTELINTLTKVCMGEIDKKKTKSVLYDKNNRKITFIKFEFDNNWNIVLA